MPREAALPLREVSPPALLQANHVQAHARAHTRSHKHAHAHTLAHASMCTRQITGRRTGDAPSDRCLNGRRAKAEARCQPSRDSFNL
eukprot:CAMPEP_0183394210 /NCGR_PEP_ID=MMETSP0370-20130417/8417_1 /TAXON_ID=268820 /ORGANISM="Peridinium aciculiferum, Strain PAER-2" /LENGTH=86 /DNA_ID=CAMNT_0025574549 /DNA_START=22 /DNA_END=282 /DNA_ORIENTATION=+